MKTHRWHDYLPGQHVPTDAIIALCEKRIQDGHIKDIQGKRLYLDKLRESRNATLVYSPQTVGWGTSPFNPKAWATTDGQRIPHRIA